MSKSNLIGDKEEREIQRQLEPLSSASWETVERFVKDLLATREAVIKRIERRMNWITAAHSAWPELRKILDFIRNPQEGSNVS